MTCHHIPSVRCPECADNRPSMGYWPTPCGTCAALREENARLKRGYNEYTGQLDPAKILSALHVAERERDEARELIDVEKKQHLITKHCYDDMVDEVARLEKERDEARDALNGLDVCYAEAQEIAVNESVGRRSAEAEVARLEELILSSCDGNQGATAVVSNASALWAEARRIRAQREEKQHRKHPTGDYCVWCHSQWPCEESSEEGR